MRQYKQEIADGQRFEFGKNWRKFLALVDNERIAQAETSLKGSLEVDTLAGRSFLDIGSGSGLLSLAARRLGARVTSFDYDPHAVGCTAELRRRYVPEDAKWTIQEGSVLDRTFMTSLGRFDIVYSWGVLHHTGSMWQALDNATLPVAPGGLLFISIYNDQGRASHRWRQIKRLYNRLPHALRFLVLWPAAVRLRGPDTIRDILHGTPFKSWRQYKRQRGMSAWTDVVDWVGGYPFEVAKPEAIFELYRRKGFVLEKLKTCGGGLGCNEFVFRRVNEPAISAH